jgi:hypothetical protein
MPLDSLWHVGCSDLASTWPYSRARRPASRALAVRSHDRRYGPREICGADSPMRRENPGRGARRCPRTGPERSGGRTAGTGRRPEPQRRLGTGGGSAPAGSGQSPAGPEAERHVRGSGGWGASPQAPRECGKFAARTPRRPVASGCRRRRPCPQSFGLKLFRVSPLCALSGHAHVTPGAPGSRDTIWSRRRRGGIVDA